MYHLPQLLSPLDLTSTLVHQMKTKAALHEQTKTNPSIEVHHPRAEQNQGTNIFHVPQLTFSMVDVYLMSVKASVPGFTPIATRSNPDLSRPTATKLVSQSAVVPSALPVRARTKEMPGLNITSNSFRDSGPAAPAAGNQDNHVAEGANLSKGTASFGAQITLVSRKSRLPAKSRQSHGGQAAMDQCTTVFEFASYLQTQSRDAEAKSKKQKPIFRDLIMYYVAKDPGRKISHSTKRRMEIVCIRCNFLFCLLTLVGYLLALWIICQSCWCLRPLGHAYCLGLAREAFARNA